MSANYNVKNWWYSGQLTNISGVAVPIANTNDLANGIVVLAPSGNLGTLFIGPSGVTVNNGFPLTPNAGTRVPVSSPQFIWAIADSGYTGLSLSWYGN